MKLRIAQLLDTLYWGGAQRMQIFLVETLAPLGIDLTVIDMSESINSLVPGRLRELGARVVQFPFDGLFSPGAFVQLWRFLQAEKFDLLHTYLTHANTVGPLLGKLSGTPVIASLRAADFEYKTFTRRRELLERRSIQAFAAVTMANGIVVGEFARARLGAKAPVAVIPNAIESLPPLADAERLALRRSVLGDAPGPLVLSVGRLVEQKGFPDLLDAYAQVQAEFPGSRLAIAGEGELRPLLEGQIARLGLAGRAVLLGLRPDARRLMGCADIYANSSVLEGTPVTLLEAMASGLPVIATRVGEGPHLLDGGAAGLLADAHAPDQLAEALRRLLGSADERARLGQAARQRVELCYNREAWRSSLLELYAQVSPRAGEFVTQLKAGQAAR
ncbi:MAG: glycosyltransferase [Chloroflexota bacterium]